MSFTDLPPVPLKKFVSEKDIEDEKVEAKEVYGGEQRKEPVVNDSRTLYEKLQENKIKKDEEFAERIKFRAPRALDEDDVSYLEGKKRQELERRIRNEEEIQRELIEFRRAQRSVIFTAEEVRPPSPTLVTPPPPKPAANKPAVQVKIRPKVAAIPKDSGNKRKIEGDVNSNSNTNSSNPNTASNKQQNTGTEKEDKPADKKPKGNPLLGLLNIGGGDSSDSDQES